MNVAVSALITRGRQIADMANATQIITDDELGAINEAYRNVYNYLCDKNDLYFVTQLVSDTDSSGKLQLPTDFFRLSAIDYSLDATNWIEAQKWSMSQRNTWQGIALVSSPMYRLWGDYIKMIPEDNTYTLRIWYFPEPETLAEDDTITYPNNLVYELLSYECALQFKRKARQVNTPEYGAIAQKYAELYAQFDTFANRDDANYEPIRNVYGQRRSYIL